MTSLLANADSSDPSQMKLVVILLSAAGIAGICGLVGLVIVLAKRMRNRHAGLINPAVMFWGLIAAGSAVYAAITQLTWSQQHFLQILSGYGDPLEVAPPLPWKTWTALAGFYLLLLGWILWERF